MRVGGGGFVGESEEALDELGAAGGDEAELGGVVAVLGAEDAGDAEEIAVEAESAEKITCIVGQARTLGDAASGWSVFGWGRCGGKAGESMQQRGLGVGGGWGRREGLKGNPCGWTAQWVSLHGGSPGCRCLVRLNCSNHVACQSGRES